MTEAKPTRVKSRGRIFPEIQWTSEQLSLPEQGLFLTGQKSRVRSWE
ncbi:MAG: hypothetical protein ACSI46_05850 [Gloeotrichia echinulata DVL01]|jgi:hypothetical protein|nr:hypothetical protein [Gloeotrichia echinulata DEX184]